MSMNPSEKGKWSRYRTRNNITTENPNYKFLRELFLKSIRKELDADTLLATYAAGTRA